MTNPAEQNEAFKENKISKEAIELLEHIAEILAEKFIKAIKEQKIKDEEKSL